MVAYGAAVDTGADRDDEGVKILPKDRLALAALVFGAVFYGRFALSAGGFGRFYIDMPRVTLQHQGAPLVGRLLCQLTSDWDYTAVGGMARGAGAVAGAMLHHSATTQRPLDAFIVTTASGDDKAPQILGADIAHRRVLVVDDTCSTGRSALAAVHAARAASATVVGVASVVDRAGDARRAIEAAGLPFRHLLTPADLQVPAAYLQASLPADPDAASGR